MGANCYFQVRESHRAATPGLSQDCLCHKIPPEKQAGILIRSGTSQTQPRRFGKHRGEGFSIYRLLSLQGLQHLPEFQTEVASDSKFDFENSNIFSVGGY